MTTVVAPKGRASVSTEFDGLQIVIPARRQIFAMLFLPIWLCGWAFGEVSAIQSVSHGIPDSGGMLFMAAWLTGWTIGGVFAVLTLLWNVAGREILKFGSGSLVYRRAIGTLGYDKSYDLLQVKDLRAGPTPAFGTRRGLDTMGLSGGQIAFDYGSSTVNVANGVDEAEAKQLVALVKGRYKV